MILLVTGSSIELALFHAGCRPSLHVGLHLLQQLYLTMGGTHPTSMSERPAQHWHLTMRGTHPTYMSERICTYIWPCEEHIHHTCQKGSALTFDHARNQSNINVRKGFSLTSAHARNQSNIHVKRLCSYIWPWEEPIQHTCSKGLCTYIYPCEEPIQHACQKGSTLTYDHVGTNPTVTSKWPSVPDWAFLVIDQVPPFS